MEQFGITNPALTIFLGFIVAALVAIFLFTEQIMAWLHSSWDQDLEDPSGSKVGRLGRDVAEHKAGTVVEFPTKKN